MVIENHREGLNIVDGGEDSNPEVAGFVDEEIVRGNAVYWYGGGGASPVKDSGEPTVDGEIGSAKGVGGYSTETEH